MSTAVLVFKLSVQSVCQLQQHKIEDLKFLSKWQDCLIGELLWQIMP